MECAIPHDRALPPAAHARERRAVLAQTREMPGESVVCAFASGRHSIRIDFPRRRKTPVVTQLCEQ